LERKLKVRKKPNPYADLLTLDHPFYYLLANRFDRIDPLSDRVALAFTLPLAGFCY
jgi:hypothetical protein